MNLLSIFEGEGILSGKNFVVEKNNLSLDANKMSIRHL